METNFHNKNFALGLALKGGADMNSEMACCNVLPLAIPEPSAYKRGSDYWQLIHCQDFGGKIKMEGFAVKKSC